jgi:hypothetical protein
MPAIDMKTAMPKIKDCRAHAAEHDLWIAIARLLFIEITVRQPDRSNASDQSYASRTPRAQRIRRRGNKCTATAHVLHGIGRQLETLEDDA